LNWLIFWICISTTRKGRISRLAISISLTQQLIMSKKEDYLAENGL
jgi:hypothetical protein